MRKPFVTSGVSHLDHLLDGLYIGDNVIWHDDSGSLAFTFCLNFIQSSLIKNKPLIYVSFDRSPRNLLEKLGKLAESQSLIILDCFSSGKGANSPIFLRFYDESNELPCRVVKVKEPRRTEEVMDVLYGVHAGLRGDVRLVFESVTGMQELWGSEESLVNFYAHSCPRLYELNTIAYWLMEKRAHSPRVRAQISQIAQVVIELSIKRGTTSLSILKAEKRSMENLHHPFTYRTKDFSIIFDEEKRAAGGIDLGPRLKELRTRRGLSQTELAKLVGVTPSAISQVESNLIYPSLPALFKMAEILSVKVTSFFQERGEGKRQILFTEADGTEIKVPEIPEGSAFLKQLTPVDQESRAEPYMIEIPPERTLPAHFFVHRGEEIGYLIAGELQIKCENEVYTAHAGDIIYLIEGNPSQWKNSGSHPAKLLWIKIRP